MKKIAVIGAGQLGSRHLQALKGVEHDLSISVVDNFQESLDVAKERYDGFNVTGGNHTVKYFDSISKLEDKDFDVVISATSSNARFVTLSELYSVAKVKYFVLEKVLFDKPEDYKTFAEMLKKNGTKAYVNCSMRTMPFYRDIKKYFEGTETQYFVTGCDYRLLSNLIHYVDHMVYLTGDTNFAVDTSLLHKKFMVSKRAGFHEFNGTAIIKFSKGSAGLFTSYNEGGSPAVVEIMNENCRIISREYQGKIWMQKKENNWEWEELDFRIPYQSELTKNIVTDLLENGKSDLVEYSESANTHVQLYHPIWEHYNANNEKLDYYPFT